MSVMSSFKVQAQTATVNIEDDSVILTGVDLDELVGVVGPEELLNAIDYSDILEYVAEVEKDKEDDEYDRYTDR